MPARYVSLPPAGPPRLLRWVDQQDPGDSLPATFDITSWASALGLSVSGLAVGIAPNGSGDIAASAVSYTAAGLLVATLTGGNIGTDYAVTFTVTFSNGDTLERTVWIYCQNMSAVGYVPASTVALIPGVSLPLQIVNGLVTIADPWTTPGILTDPTGLPSGSLYNRDGSWAWVP